MPTHPLFLGAEISKRKFYVAVFTSVCACVCNQGSVQGVHDTFLQRKFHSRVCTCSVML